MNSASGNREAYIEQSTKLVHSQLKPPVEIGIRNSKQLQWEQLMSEMLLLFFCLYSCELTGGQEFVG
jgi:hypothetical protein